MLIKGDLSYDEIYSVCKEPLKSHLEDVLRFIEVEGFIYSRLIQKDAFSIPETKYSLGMQPAFDYLMARKKYMRHLKRIRLLKRNIPKVFINCFRLL